MYVTLHDALKNVCEVWNPMTWSFCLKIYQFFAFATMLIVQDDEKHTLYIKYIKLLYCQKTKLSQKKVECIITIWFTMHFVSETYIGICLVYGSHKYVTIRAIFHFEKV